MRDDLRLTLRNLSPQPQNFGTGPMALLKQIRLSQVQHALSSQEVQHSIGGNTVHELAFHYGFQSRNHFARD